MTFKNNRAPLFFCFKLCASYSSHWWIQTGVTVRKRRIWVKSDDILSCVTLKFDFWPWPFAWTSLLSLVITPENFMKIQWWESKRCDGQMGGQTKNTIHGTAWSQLKMSASTTSIAICIVTMVSVNYSVFCFWILYHVGHGTLCDIIMVTKNKQLKPAQCQCKASALSGRHICTVWHSAGISGKCCDIGINISGIAARSRQSHRTSNGMNPCSGFRDMGSAKSGTSVAWFDKSFGQWVSPYGPNGQITMTLHNYRSRQVHKTLNGVNPSSSFRNMHSAKSGPNLWQIWQIFGPWASPYAANGQMTMAMHNYRPRQFHRTWNGENPSSGYRDMGSASLAAARPAARPPSRPPKPWRQYHLQP